MRNELNQIEKVELYLNGELNIAEQTAFENQMSTDTQLAELVAAQQLVQQAALRKAIRADVLKYGAGGGFFTKWWMAFAGAGVVLLLLGSVYLLNFNETAKEKTVLTEVHNVEQSKTNEVVITPVIEAEIIADTVVITNRNKANTAGSEALMSKSDKTKESYSYEEDSHCDGLKTWADPDSQMFDIVAEKGATIEGKDGTLIIVPENAFLDENGKTISGTVQLELVEALYMSEMVAYNLTTMNGDNALQSGGMIYVQPRVNGKDVEISKTNPLYIEIPTDDYNTDMMAWEGEVDANGDIDWNNPKPLEKYLTKVDFKNLDFLPDGFESAVSAGLPFKSYKKATDELVDSLYYSLGEVSSAESEDNVMPVIREEEFEGKREGKDARTKRNRNSEIDFSGQSSIKGKVVDLKGEPIPFASAALYYNEILIGGAKTNYDGEFKIKNIPAGTYDLEISYVGFRKERFESVIVKENRVVPLEDIVLTDQDFIEVGVTAYKTESDPEVLVSSDGMSSFSEEKSTCYINPLSVKSIRTKAFANTFLATKEFQERIKLLHGIENAQSLFDLYLNNLSKDLWEVDQMIANKLKGEEKAIFQKLADQKLTNVENDGIHQKQLSAYYNSKLKESKVELKKRKEKYAKTSTAQLKKEQSKLSKIIKDYNKVSSQINGGTTITSNKKTSLAPFDINNKITKTQSTKVVNSIPAESINVVTSVNSYATPWFTGGWMNIDAYLHELSKGSKEVEITDESLKDGKTNRMKIYQCLNALKTIVPLTVAGWVAKAKFPNENSIMGQKMRSTYCIGIKNEDGKTFFAHQKFNPYNVDEVKINWEEIKPKYLLKKIESLPGFNTRLIRNLDRERNKIEAELKVQARKEELKQEKASLQKDIDTQKDKVALEQAKLDAENCFIESLREVVDKCGITEPVYDIEAIFDFVEVMPEFPGGSVALYQFLSENMTYPKEAMDASIQGKVYVSFVVTNLGLIQDVKVNKGIDILIDAEAVRVVSSMPNWEPGKDQDKDVSVRFNLPINFQID
jgi:TonB family protein